MSTTAETLSEEPVLLRSDEAGVATLTLNRPRQANALSEALLAALEQAVEDLFDDDTVRVAVVTGAGRAFCAGHDLKEMRAHPDRAYFDALFGRSSRLMRRIAELPKPVIARVQGVATAAGCQLVAACDLAVASTAARFAVNGVNQGLFCSTPAVPLSRSVSRKRAFEMLVTGEFIDAETAAEYGLVNRAVPPEELDAEVARIARAIVANSPTAIAIGKDMFYQQLEKDLDGAYAYASDVMACNMMDEDAAEGIDAFLEKRAPRWKKKG